MSKNIAPDTGEKFRISRVVSRMTAGRTTRRQPVDAEGYPLSPADSERRPRERAAPAPVREEGLDTWPLPGLAPMTRVRTSFGDVHAVALRKGDPVLTNTGEFRPIVWLNRIMLDEHILRLKPDCNPIVIGANALGPSAPACEIQISPRQIIAGDHRSGLSGSREAATLRARPGIHRLQESGLSYTMFHVGEAAEIYVEGLYLRVPIET